MSIRCIGSGWLTCVYRPSCPHGMVKPSPDCTPRPIADGCLCRNGWMDLPRCMSVVLGRSRHGKCAGHSIWRMEWTGSTIMITVSMKPSVWDIMTRSLSRTAFVRKSPLPIALLFYIVYVSEDSLKSLCSGLRFLLGRKSSAGCTRGSAVYLVLKFRCFPTMKLLVIHVFVADGTTERLIRYISMRRQTVRCAVLPER